MQEQAFITITSHSSTECAPDACERQLRSGSLTEAGQCVTYTQESHTHSHHWHARANAS